MSYGVTAEGFVVKPLQVIKDDLGSALRGVFGSSFDLEPESVNGQLVGIFSDRLSDLWQLGQAVYDAAYPDTASGISLDYLLALTGAARLPATYSQVSATVVGTPATVFAPGDLLISVLGVGTQFTNTGTITIPGGGSIAANFRAVGTGPKVAPAGTLTEIDTPLTGLTSVTNPTDQHILGTDIELDPAARLRREMTIRAIGSASAEAVRARVSDITGVTAVNVFENESDATDSQGVPPHAIEVVVSGGTDAAIAQAIYDCKAAGVGTYGTTTQSVTGADGLTRSIKFSRPVAVLVYHTINVTVESGIFPDDGAAQIKEAVAAWGDLNLTIGTDVVSSKIVPTIFTIPGVLDVTTLPDQAAGAAPGAGVHATIAISNRQRAEFDTGRITVVIT